MTGGGGGDRAGDKGGNKLACTVYVESLMGSIVASSRLDLPQHLSTLAAPHMSHHGMLLLFMVGVNLLCDGCNVGLVCRNWDVGLYKECLMLTPILAHQCPILFGYLH